METIEKVIDLNHFCYKTESQRVKSLSIALDNLFTLSLYEPYALLMVFFLYEFYYLQRKTLIIDILNDFKVELIKYKGISSYSIGYTQNRARILTYFKGSLLFSVETPEFNRIRTYFL